MQDDLDKLIDGALAGYSSAEPLAGLEQRVLNRARAERSSRQRRGWWTAVALAASAVAAALVAVAPQRRVPAPVAVVLPPPQVEPASPAVVSGAAPRPAAAVRRARGPRVLPKRNLFPTPSPLSPQERLLVQLAESRPQLLLGRPVDEICIKPIEIAPLQVDGGQ
jgi:hypothetical protein